MRTKVSKKLMIIVIKPRSLETVVLCDEAGERRSDNRFYDEQKVEKQWLLG